jgi:glycosyltransferase A (GT-A) superfamily protein (DUF2064 family)
MMMKAVTSLVPLMNDHAWLNTLATTSTHVAQAMVVGTDIPDISGDILRTVGALLDTYDVVFGPVIDGGYYLVAVKRPHRCLFTGIAWSTSTVLAQSLERARGASLSVAPLEAVPCLVDVDTKQVLCFPFPNVCQPNQIDTRPRKHPV